MDYEDNDFQSQSFQLAIEENVKFSPGSHSYSLPKFDLDDNLQVHLRYDSLVESDILLGIQSQENHWIEDYSRESSGLEFSSGPTESCSISRRNNVWSEATSSESVDLLLKSIGQDDTIMGQTIIEESDNCDGLEGLKNQMEPTVNQDGVSPSRTENVTSVGSELTLHDPMEQSSPESVLLLKPVRQNEMIMGSTITESDNCDGLDSLKNEKLPSLEQDGLSQCETENTTCVGSMSTLDEPVEQFSELDNVLVDQLPQTESTSQNDERERSINEGICLNLIEEGSSSNGLSRNESCIVTAMNDEVFLVDKSEGNDAMNSSAITVSVQANASTVSVQSLVNAGELGSDVPQNDIGLEKVDAETVRDYMNCEGDMVDTDGNNLGKSTSSLQNAESVSHITQLSSNVIYAQHTAQISVCEHISSSEDAELVVPLRTDGLEEVRAETVDNHREPSSRMNSQTCGGDLVNTEGNNARNLSTSDHQTDSVSHITELCTDVIFTQSTAQFTECLKVISSKDTDLVDQAMRSSQEEPCFVVEGENTSVAHSAHHGACSTEVSSIQIIHTSDKTDQGFCSVESIMKEDSSENVGHQLEDSIPVSKAEDSSENVGHQLEDILVSKVEDCSESVGHHLEDSITVSNVEDSSESVGHQLEDSTPSRKLEDSSENVAHRLEDSTPSSKLEDSSENVGHQLEDSTPSSKLEDSLENVGHQLEDGILVSKTEALLQKTTTLSQGLGNDKSDDHMEHSSIVAVEMCSSESTGVVSEITNTASNDILGGVHHLLLRSDIVNTEDIKQKENLNSPSHIDNSLMVKQDDTLATLSDLDPNKSSPVSIELVPSLGAEHNEVCDSCREPPVEVIGHSSSSLLDTSGVICQNEPEADVAKIDAQQQGFEQLQESPVILHAAVKEDDGAEVCAVYKEEPVLMEAEGISNEEIAKHPSQPFSRESSNDIGPKVLDNNEGSETKNGPGTAPESTEGSLSGCEGLIFPGALPKSDAEGCQLEAESGILNSIEPNCGSPTIISCSEASRNEKEQRETHTPTLHHIESDALEQEAGKVRDGANDPKDNDAFEDDRNFTFKVNSVADLSEKEAVSGWKPFPSMVTHEIPQSSSFCDANSEMLEDVSDGNPPISGLINASESSKGNALDEAKQVVQDAEREISEDGMAQNKDPLHGENEHQELVRFGSSVAVTSNINKVENVDAPTIPDSKENITAEVERSVCSDVNFVTTLSENEPCDRWKPIHNTQPREFPETVGVSLPASSTVGVSLPASSSMSEMGLNVPAVCDPKVNIAAEADKRVSSAVMPMVALSENEACDRWTPVHSAQPHEFSQTVGVSPPIKSSICQMDSIALHEISPECRPQASGTKSARRKKGNVEEKTRLSSGKTPDKENDKEVKVLKEMMSTKPTKVGGSNYLCPSTSPAPLTHEVQAGEVRDGGFTEGSSIKSSVLTTAQTSNLPDLNNSISSYMLFQQPFTDYQQVQLRAQIFVYGSIIQGTAPDEACMLAAFGESDGGRRSWENVWRLAVERLRNPKSPLSSAKTPAHIHNGARATEATRQNVHRSEAVCTPGGADSNRSPSVGFNVNTPFSSPIWAVSTASRDGPLNSMPKGPILDSSKTFIPLQPYQSPQGRQYLGNASPWLAQLPSPGTWVVTAQSAAVDASGRHPSLPISESVRVTSVRESSASHRSVKQLATPSPFVHMASPSAPVGKSLAIDPTTTTVSSGKHNSSEAKPRKKRRNMTSDESGQIASIIQPHRDPVSVTARLPTTVATTTISPGPPPTSVATTTKVSSHSLTPVARTSLNFAQSPTSIATAAITSAKLPAAVAKTTTTSPMNVASGSRVSGSSPVFFSLDQVLGGRETELKVVLPEDLCGGVEQAKQQAEDAAALAATTVRHCQSIWSQLAIQRNSGAVSGLQATLESSAVSVAAAVSVAKAAAAVAKVASDAALQAKLMADEALATSKSGNPTGTFLRDDVKSLGRVTPSSILKGRDQTSNSDSVLVAVREAAKKRVEAASAAAKRAENLDALLKAAEMTAEAVSQAGTIIAMGEPLPFTLAELVDAGPEGYWKVQQKSAEQFVRSSNLLTQQTHKDAIKEGNGGSLDKLDEQLTNKIGATQIVQLSKNSADDLQSSSISSSRKGYVAQKGCKEYNLLNTVGNITEAHVVSETTPVTIQNDENDRHLLVKALSKNNFEEGSVVEVRSDEEGLRMAWFSAKVLSLKDGKAFVSYTAHARLEGSSQLTEWVSLDDKGGNAPRIRTPHPMAGVKYEGTKKRNRAARGDYAWSVGDKVDAWLRNGWWEGVITEKSKEDETNLTVHFPAQQETSVVRAWNLRTSLVWEDGKWIEWCRPMASNTMSFGVDTPQEKPSKKSRLEGDADPTHGVKEKGKMTKIPDVTEARSSEVVKPLTLSSKEKVFNAGKNTTKDTLGRKLTGLQKDGPKVNFGIPKPGKKRKFMDVSNVSKPAGFKYGKPPGPSTVSSRDVASDSIFKSGKSQGPSIPSRDVASDSSLKSGKHLGPSSVSSRDVPLDSLPSKKKPPSDVTAEPQSKGKATPLSGKFGKNNEKDGGHDYYGNVMPNAVEPRRSNRRIQPTSRLLEGLQSSLIVSKIPAAPHDRGAKSQQRSSRGRTHG